MGQYSHSDLSHCNTTLAFPVIDWAGWLFWRLTAEQLDISNWIFMVLFDVPDHRKPRAVMQSYRVFCCHFYHSFINAKKYGNLRGIHTDNDLKWSEVIFVNEVCNFLQDESQQTLVSRENVMQKCSGIMHNASTMGMHSFIHFIFIFLISKDALN